MRPIWGIAFVLFDATVAFAQVGSLEATFRLETVTGITVPYQNGMPVPSFEKQPRQTISLAGVWKELRFNANHDLSLLKRDSSGYAQLLAEAADRQSPYYNDSTWQEHSIPGLENTLNAVETVPEYYENGVWYRTNFSTPDSLKQKFVKLNFYAVNYIADVWLNGKYLGWHEGGFTPFSFDVSSVLRSDSSNVLAVRVDNIPWGTRNDIVPFYTCDWFNYTGIIHDVYLECSDKLSVVRADVITKDVNGLVQISAVVKNANSTNEDVDVTLRVYKANNDSLSLTKEVSADLAGSEVTPQGVSQQTLSIPADSIAAWQAQLTIPNPNLWSPRKPDLYILKVTLSQGGMVKDEFYTQFGVRTIQTANDRIQLNGKTIFLHGVARHEDHPSYGRSVPTSVILSDLKIVKSANANYLRSGHYPNHPYTYLAADRLGLLVMEEIPVWWFNDGQPWGIQNVVRHVHLQMFREMVFRDRNRSSIGLWSTSNECQDVPGRITFLQSIRIEVESLYPDGRLIAQSAAADRPGPYDESQGYCDVAGWTMYFGIFYDPYGLGMYRGTRNFILDANDYYPLKPVIATEFGYWSGENMAQFPRQVEVFDSTFLAFTPHLPILADGNPNPFGFLAGVTWWCMFDWYTHQQPHGFQSMGLMRMNRGEAKPVFASVQAKYQQYINISENITGIGEANSSFVPHEFSLSQSFPNPSNPSSMIRYTIPTRSHVLLSIFNTLGQKVADLANGDEEPGTYNVRFDAQGLASGVYFYRLQAGSYVQTRKLIVVK